MPKFETRIAAIKNKCKASHEELKAQRNLFRSALFEALSNVRDAMSWLLQVVPRYNIISGTCEKLCYSETYVIYVIHDSRNFFGKKMLSSPFSSRNGCVGVNALGTT